jgi:hypothetical protein
MSRQETRGPWIKFPKAWWEDHKILNLTKLSKKQCDALDDLWVRIHNKPVSPFPSINNDPVRDEIDGIICGILNVPPLKVVQNMLVNEPIISDKAL